MARLIIPHQLALAQTAAAAAAASAAESVDCSRCLSVCCTYWHSQSRMRCRPESHLSRRTYSISTLLTFLLHPWGLINRGFKIIIIIETDIERANTRDRPAGKSPQWQKSTGKQHSCSNACLWLFRRECAVSFQNTMITEWSVVAIIDTLFLSDNFHACGFVRVRTNNNNNNNNKGTKVKK